MKLRRCGCVCAVLYRAQHLRLFIDTSVCVWVNAGRRNCAGWNDWCAEASCQRSAGSIQCVCTNLLRRAATKKWRKKKWNDSTVRPVHHISNSVRSSCCHHRSVYSAYSICPAVPFQSKKKTQNRKAKNKSNPWDQIVSFMQRLKKRGGGFRIQDR